MLDGSLKRPFFARHADGSMVYPQTVGGMGQEAVMLDCIPGCRDDDWLLVVLSAVNYQCTFIVLPPGYHPPPKYVPPPNPTNKYSYYPKPLTNYFSACRMTRPRTVTSIARRQGGALRGPREREACVVSGGGGGGGGVRRRGRGGGLCLI